jgi:hypothetical protein
MSVSRQPAMKEVTNLLAKATMRELTPVSDSNSSADSTSKPVLHLRKAFDHFLFFRTIYDTTSGHTPGSEHIVAGLSSVGELDIPQLKSWLGTHGNNVKQTNLQLLAFMLTKTGKSRSYSIYLHYHRSLTCLQPSWSSRMPWPSKY